MTKGICKVWPVTVAIRAQTSALCTFRESRLWRALRRLRNAVEDGVVLPGGGAVEMICAAALDRLACDLDGAGLRSKYAGTKCDASSSFGAAGDSTCGDPTRGAISAMRLACSPGAGDAIRAFAAALRTLPETALRNAGLSGQQALQIVGESSVACSRAWDAWDGAARLRWPSEGPRIVLPPLFSDRVLLSPLMSTSAWYGSKKARKGHVRERGHGECGQQHSQLEETRPALDAVVYEDARSRLCLFRRAAGLVGLLLQSDAVVCNVGETPAEVAKTESLGQLW